MLHFVKHKIFLRVKNGTGYHLGIVAPCAAADGASLLKMRAPAALQPVALWQYSQNFTTASNPLAYLALFVADYKLEVGFTAKVTKAQRHVRVETSDVSPTIFLTSMTSSLLKNNL